MARVGMVWCSSVSDIEANSIEASPPASGWFLLLLNIYQIANVYENSRTVKNRSSKKRQAVPKQHGFFGLPRTGLFPGQQVAHPHLSEFQYRHRIPPGRRYS